MRLIGSTIRSCLPGLGVGKRWLREQLGVLGVRIRLSEGCVDELVNDAHAAAERRLAAGDVRKGGYRGLLRDELSVRANFVRSWTDSDERLDGCESLVKIARKYALPRPWKLSEPVATACIKPAPAYWRWASHASSTEMARTA